MDEEKEAQEEVERLDAGKIHSSTPVTQHDSHKSLLYIGRPLSAVALQAELKLPDVRHLLI